MASYKHRITGVILNEMSVERTSIDTPDEAYTIHILRNEGKSIHTIAQMFGINQGRVSDVCKGRTFKGSWKRALTLLKP
jgi:hypothetical protein